MSNKRKGRRGEGRNDRPCLETSKEFDGKINAVVFFVVF